MMIILLNIARDTGSQELIEFISKGIKGGLFYPKGKLQDINILKIIDKDGKAIEYQGLVRIEPDAVALRVISKLDGKLLNDRPITVRQYFIRTWHNDRRTVEAGNAASFKGYRKIATRRRNLVTVRAPVSF